MQLLRSNKIFIILMFGLQAFNAHSQDVINSVEIKKINATLFRVNYQLKHDAGKQVNEVTLKIFRRRSGKVEEVFSTSISPRNTQSRTTQSYIYDWETDTATVKAEDELQAKIFLSYNQYITKAGNIPPKANAGAFMEMHLPITNHIVLNGSKSQDADGKIRTAKWKQIAGPGAIVISNADSLISYITSDLKEGTYAFELTVTDNNGATAMDRIVVTIKSPLPVWTTPKTDVTITQKKDSIIARQVKAKQNAGKLKGGPGNALINLVLPGVGHYFVSGDHRGNNRKPVSFIITGLYAGSIGGGMYYMLKADKDHNKYKELSDYREYQRDQGGNIIGVRGGNEADAKQHLSNAKAAQKNAIIFFGAAGGILVGDLVYTFIKGSANKTRWKKESTSKAKLFISSDGVNMSAGIRLKL